MKNPDRIPSLDGIRALAILIVVVGHFAVRFKDSLKHFGLFWKLLGSGGVGVDIFFVLSGFLITTLLVREHERTGTISLRSFYLRRAFRIIPAFYIYLATVLLLVPVIGWKMPWKGVVYSALFLYDYADIPHPWLVGHTWSLAVEEQFYILWPLLLGFLLSKRGRRAAMHAAIFIIVASTMVRNIDGYFHNASFLVRDFMMLHTRIDTLMFGCLFALASGTRRFEEIYTATRKFWWFFPAFFLILGNLLTRMFGLNFRLSCGLTLNSIAIAFFILHASRAPSTWASRLLNLRPVAFVGVLSYSIYLWQELFTAPENTTWSGRIPGMVLCIVVVPVLSYFLIERPTLRLRSRILAGNGLVAQGTTPVPAPGLYSKTLVERL